MNDNDAHRQDDDEITGEDVLDAFNAGDLADRPGEPPHEPLDDASNADAPAPG